VRLEVIPSVFAWVFASSGTWGLLWLQSSCDSWWLPPPRRLRAAIEVWHVFVIVHGWLRWFVRGSCAFLGGAPKTTLVDCSCYWVITLAVGSCSALGELGFGLPISRRTMKWWSTQRGHSMLVSTWTSGKNCVSPLWLISWISPSDWSSYYCDWFISRRGGIKITFLLFTFPQTSCNKLFSIVSFESLSYLC
jgi:hypothetical protein